MIAVLAAGSAAPAPLPLAHREVLPNGIVLLVAERPAVPIVAVARLRAGGRRLRSRRPRGAGQPHGDAAHAGHRASGRGPSWTRPSSSWAAASRPAPAATGSRSRCRCSSKDLGARARPAGRGRAVADVPRGRADAQGRGDPGRHQALRGGPGHGRRPRPRAARLSPATPTACPVEGTRNRWHGSPATTSSSSTGTHARPDTAIIAVVGAVTVDEARREVLARFGGWPRPARSPRRRPATASAAATPRGDDHQARADARRRSCSDVRPSARPIPTISRWPSRPTSSAAARPRGSTRACGTRAGSRTPSTATSAPARYGASFVVGAQTPDGRGAEGARHAAARSSARMGREPVHRPRARAGQVVPRSAASRCGWTRRRRWPTSSWPSRMQGLGLDYADRYRARHRKGHRRRRPAGGRPLLRGRTPSIAWCVGDPAR